MDTQHISQNDAVHFPEPTTDYHGHPNYLKVLIFLFGFFALSLVVGYFPLSLVTVIVIFGTALYKATLVVKNFMHLKYEPVLIWIAVIAVFFCLIAFFFGVYPDITAAKLDVVPR